MATDWPVVAEQNSRSSSLFLSSKDPYPGLKAISKRAGATLFLLTPSLKKIRHVSLQLATVRTWGRLRTKEGRNEHPRSLCVPAVLANTRDKVSEVNLLSLSKHLGNCQTGNIHSQFSNRGWKGGEENYSEITTQILEGKVLSQLVTSLPRPQFDFESFFEGIQDPRGKRSRWDTCVYAK